MKISEFIEIYQDSIQSASPCAALKKINKARAALWPLGDWIGTMGYGIVNINKADSCFYAPPSIHKIKEARILSGGNIKVKASEEISFGEWANCCKESECCSNQDITIYDTGLSSSAPWIPSGASKRIGFASPDSLTEVIIKVSYMYGSTKKMQEIKTKGLEVSYTNDPVTIITSLTKSIGGATVYQEAIEKPIVIATLPPCDGSINYSIYKYSGCAPCSCLLVKGKKRLMLIKEEDLELELDINPAALEIMILSGIYSLKSEKVNQARAYYTDAIAALNLELKTEESGFIGSQSPSSLIHTAFSLGEVIP